MSHADFVHLHLHTEYSLLDGACRLDRLMDKAHDLKFSSLAITDHGVLYGAIEFFQKAREKGIKPIIGCEVYVAPGSRLEKKAGSGGRDIYNHLVLLAKDDAGYKNLIKLTTAAHLDGYYYKPRIDKEILAAHKEGLIALSGCLASEIPDAIMKDQLPKAREAIDWFKQTLGAENFYLELQNHGIPEQAKVNRHLILWAKEFGVKLVATNDVHYVEKKNSHAHDCLVCIGTQDLLSNPKRMGAGYAVEQFYLRSAEEMKARFTEIPEAVTNTLEVAEKCNLEIEFGKLHYPVFEPPEYFSREGFLRKLLAEGLYRRYTITARAEGHEFIIEGIEDARRLPTYRSAESGVRSAESNGNGTSNIEHPTSNAESATSPQPSPPEAERGKNGHANVAGEGNPLTPSLSPNGGEGEKNGQASAGGSSFAPTGGEGARRADEGATPDSKSVPLAPIGGEGRGEGAAATATATDQNHPTRTSSLPLLGERAGVRADIPSNSQSYDIKDPAVAAAIKVVIDRLQVELVTIEKTGFISYFLIVADFIRYGREHGITCVARGSAAGSLVTYLLEIANVDPIRYGLLFERFLNPERINPPDIDIDFADDRRADVINYVRQKYGDDSVAQIITFGTMGAKSVVRDVGRVMGLSYGECDRLAKMIPFDLKMDLTKALKQSPELKAAYDSEEVTRELIDTAFVLEDLTRNASVHAAGVVIGDQPLVNLLPLKRDEEGSLVTQYAMNPVGDLGLLKMDFLGLKTLTVIRNTCEMVKAGKGIDVPIDNLPLDDAKTYDLLNKAQTLGIFQLESGGMRDLCRKFQISSVEHITALIALYRPGPMELIPEFIKRRHGEVKIEYEHPLLEPICRETYGIMVYQEQVMQAAQVLAGYTLGGADLLRRAMGKKKVEEMQKQRETFVKGCAATNKIPSGKANQVFDLLEKFAGYGFNKSHAAAYAIVAYQTAYLKANYPVEFLSAMMTNDMNDTAKLGLFIAEARAMGIEVLPPDVNESVVMFAPARGGTVIRFGMAAIKGVGEIAVQSLLDARKKAGDFKTLLDMCERADIRTVNRKVLEALIKSGACDTFKETRKTLFARIDSCLTRVTNSSDIFSRGQGGFDAILNVKSSAVEQNLVTSEEWPQHELLAAEKELLGFYVTGHPLTPYAPILQKYALATTATLPSLANRSLTRIGGLVAAVQHGISKKSGKPYALLTLEDLEGSVQVLCMNENYDKYRELFEPNKALLVVGEVNTGDDKPKIFPQEIMPLEDAPKKYTKQVHFRLHTAHLKPEDMNAVEELTAAHRGRCPLFLCFKRPTGEIIFVDTHEKFNVAPGLQLQKAVDDRFGEETYYVKVDPTLPERQRPKWEKRGGSDNGEE